MKKCTITLPFIACFISLAAFSQLRDSLEKIYSNQTIYQSGNKYLKGNERLSYKDLRLEFNTPVTQDLYRRSGRKILVSRIFNVASLAVIVTSVFTKTSVAGSIEFSAGTGALGRGGLYYQIQANKLIENALWIKNREVLFGTREIEY
jgi:hypothetical protein